MNGHPIPLTERTDRTTRERILHAALQTLVERKDGKVSLRQIADRAGVVYGSVHYHFKNKNALFLALLDELVKPNVEERAEMLLDKSIPARNKLETLFQRNEELIRREKEIRVILTLLLQSSDHPVVRDKVRQMYREWRKDITLIISQGVQDGDFSPEHAIKLPELVVGLIDGISIQYFIDPESIDLAEYFRYVRMVVHDQLETKD